MNATLPKNRTTHPSKTQEEPHKSIIWITALSSGPCHSAFHNANAAGKSDGPRRFSAREAKGPITAASHPLHSVKTSRRRRSGCRSGCRSRRRVAEEDKKRLTQQNACREGGLEFLSRTPGVRFSRAGRITHKSATSV